MTSNQYVSVSDFSDVGHVEPYDIGPLIKAFSIVESANGQPLATTVELPDNYAVYYHAESDDRTPLMNIQKALGVMPNCVFKADGAEYCLYRLHQAEDRAKLEYVTPRGAVLLGLNADIPLPDNDTGDAYQLIANNLEGIATIESEDIKDAANELGLAWPPPPEPHPIMRDVPLLPFSLLGQADELEDLALASQPLLGQVCLSGQATVWYGPPNSGKTVIANALVATAIRDGRILAGNVYFINADDNGKGIAEKARIYQDLGAHMLVPSFNGFRAEAFKGLLLSMANQNKALGVFIIIDTIKKFASLMDKTEMSSFTKACRHFVEHGGTILAFAHTNKQPLASGALQYAGTTDLMEDYDAAYIVTPLESDDGCPMRVVRFECKKRRGDSPDKAAYAYSTENGLSYEQLMASVEEATFDKLGELERIFEERSDADIIEAIKACILEGVNTKMQIAATVAQRTKTSGKSVLRIVERYTGTDPDKHHWTFSIKDRGKHMFELLQEDAPDIAKSD